MNKSYFGDYCGYGSYDENYLLHSGVEHCISIVDPGRTRYVIVFGTNLKFDEASALRASVRYIDTVSQTGGSPLRSY